MKSLIIKRQLYYNIYSFHLTHPHILKCLELLQQQHRVTSQKIWIFITLQECLDWANKEQSVTERPVTVQLRITELKNTYHVSHK